MPSTPSDISPERRAYWAMAEDIARIAAERDRLREALERITAYPEIPHLERYADWAMVRRIAREALS